MHTELTLLHMTKLHAKELTQEGERERDWYVNLTTPTKFEHSHMNLLLTQCYCIRSTHTHIE